MHIHTNINTKFILIHSHINSVVLTCTWFIVTKHVHLGREELIVSTETDIVLLKWQKISNPKSWIILKNQYIHYNNCHLIISRFPWIDEWESYHINLFSSKKYFSYKFMYLQIYTLTICLYLCIFIEIKFYRHTHGLFNLYTWI